jgi:hypothetical protein
MEAYQVEADYGRTIEAYGAPLQHDGDARTVDFLRVGRVALVYTTFDRTESGYWDRATKSWKALPQEYNHAVARGLQIARKQSPPDMLLAPVPAPEAGR